MEKREVSGGSLQRASQPCTMPVPSVYPRRGVCTCVCGRGGRDVCEVSVVSETFFPPRGFPAVQCLSPSTTTTHRTFCSNQTGRRRDHQGRCFVRQDASDPVELPVRGFSSSQWDGPGTPSGVTHTHAGDRSSARGACV